MFKHKLYAVYDLNNSEICLGLFTADYIIKHFNITRDGFYKALHRHSTINKRYIVETTEYTLEDEINE